MVIMSLLKSKACSTGSARQTLIMNHPPPKSVIQKKRKLAIRKLLSPRFFVLCSLEPPPCPWFTLEKLEYIKRGEEKIKRPGQRLMKMFFM